ncbi:MAG: hypothetical protein ACYDCC_10120 [Actinomycetota bacterium]
MKRVFWAVVGVGIGAVIGVSVVRTVNRTKQRMAPSNIAKQGALRSGAFMDRLREAIDEGRKEMIQKEAELRAELNLDN